MAKLTATFAYSIGKKLIMALTGLFLVSFLLVHLSGNLQLITDSTGLAFNKYTKFMTTNPMIRVSEIVLVLGFLVHIIDGLALTMKNKKARPVKYAMNKASKNSKWVSRNMALTGSIVLIFLGVHIAQFWGAYKFAGGEDVKIENALGYKVKEEIKVNGVTVVKAGHIIDKEAYETLMSGGGPSSIHGTSMYKIVEDAYSKIYFVIFYVLCMALLALHLNHGFQSAFQTLGLSHKTYNPLIKGVGTLLSILVCAAFAAIPVFMYIQQLMAS